jgi:hypothetical protein
MKLPIFNFFNYFFYLKNIPMIRVQHLPWDHDESGNHAEIVEYILNENKQIIVMFEETASVYCIYKDDTSKLPSYSPTKLVKQQIKGSQFLVYVPTPCMNLPILEIELSSRKKVVDNLPLDKLKIVPNYMDIIQEVDLTKEEVDDPNNSSTYFQFAYVTQKHDFSNMTARQVLDMFDGVNILRSFTNTLIGIGENYTDNFYDISELTPEEIRQFDNSIHMNITDREFLTMDNIQDYLSTTFKNLNRDVCPMLGVNELSTSAYHDLLNQCVGLYIIYGYSHFFDSFSKKAEYSDLNIVRKEVGIMSKTVMNEDKWKRESKRRQSWKIYNEFPVDVQYALYRMGKFKYTDNTDVCMMFYIVHEEEDEKYRILIRQLPIMEYKPREMNAFYLFMHHRDKMPCEIIYNNPQSTFMLFDKSFKYTFAVLNPDKAKSELHNVSIHDLYKDIIEKIDYDNTITDVIKLHGLIVYISQNK